MPVISGCVPSSMPAARLACNRAPFRLSLGCRQSSWRTPSIFPRNGSIAQRWYGSQGKAIVHDYQLACTWLTKTPEKITLDDIISSLPTIPSSSGRTRIPVLLVTPSFAPWIDTSSPFLGQWMNQLYREASVDDPSTPLHAIAAVVDKLPVPRGEPQNEIGPEDTDSASAAECEGMSLLFVNAADVQGKAAPTRQIRSTGAEESALVFSVQTTASGAPYEVGLRLANTVFISGNQNTLFGMRWHRDTSSRKLVLNQSVDLSQCLVKSNAKAVHDSMVIPLHPVSQRRKVVTSMGNILRQVTKSVDGKSAEPMPASSELEKELPRYISEQNIVDQRVSVWALVEKPDCSINPHEANVHKRVIDSIHTGGKLHRVMSGGGGWGKKQGLLSLDPETSFSDASGPSELLTVNDLFGASEAEPISDLPFPFDMEATVDDLSYLSQVARAGDYIQFFVSVNPEHPRLGSSKDEGEAITYQFGVVTDAEIPISSTVDGEHQNDMVVLPNYFSALSEKGMTYSRPMTGAELSEEAPGSSTKIDVPGSRVELKLE